MSMLSPILGTHSFASSEFSELLSDESEDEKIGKAEDLVKDWSKPTFALFITGRQHGYIEPCGCITLARQKGGLMRRHTVQKILQDRGWDVIALDAGNQVRRFGQQPVIKLGKTYEALCKEMNYEMIGLGPDDLKLSAIDLAQKMNDKIGDRNPFTCANVTVLDESLTNRFVVIERNGKRIGVTMVLGEEHIKDLTGKDDLTIITPAEGLKRVQPELDAAKCDMKVLFAFTTPENCRKLAEQFPIFDVLVTAGGAGDPTLQPEIIETGDHITSMIQVGVKGMYVGLIGYYENEGRPEIKYERVQLDHRYTDSEPIKAIFKAYQEELKVLWETNSLEDIAPANTPAGTSLSVQKAVMIAIPTNTTSGKMESTATAVRTLRQRQVWKKTRTMIASGCSVNTILNASAATRPAGTHRTSIPINQGCWTSRNRRTCTPMAAKTAMAPGPPMSRSRKRQLAVRSTKRCERSWPMRWW